MSICGSHDLMDPRCSYVYINRGILMEIVTIWIIQAKLAFVDGVIAAGKRKRGSAVYTYHDEAKNVTQPTKRISLRSETHPPIPRTTQHNARTSPPLPVKVFKLGNEIVLSSERNKFLIQLTYVISQLTLIPSEPDRHAQFFSRGNRARAFSLLMAPRILGSANSYLSKREV